MLIACKCLNITLKSTANNLPSTLPIATQLSNYDEISYKTTTTITTTTTTSSNANQVHTVSSSIDDNHDEQPPYIQCTNSEKLNSNQLQFFRTVSNFKVLSYAWALYERERERANVIWNSDYRFDRLEVPVLNRYFFFIFYTLLQD